MKSIRTLVPDLQEIIKKDGWFTDQLAVELAGGIQFQFNRDEHDKKGLSISRLGTQCPKHLWHSVHTPELAQPLRPQTKLMFKYGHVVEQLAISLIKAAGHTVEGEQEEVHANGVVGHIDCIVDGCILDVKSSSTRGMEKFRSGKIALDDEFGYLCQLDGYLHACMDHPSVLVKDRAYLLAIDKQLGNMILYEHKFRHDYIERRINSFKATLGSSQPPKCECRLESSDNGNVRLGTRASYSPFKYVCCPRLRTFIYAGGKPQYFTTVVKRPANKDGPLVEVDKFGNRVYN